MGLIKSAFDIAKQSFDSSVKDSVRDYYRCEGLGEGILMAPGKKVIRQGAHNNGSSDVLSDGSVFDVSAGQCAIVLENGKIHDIVVCYTDEGAGQYQFKTDQVPSFWGTDKFMKNLQKTFTEMIDRAFAGGQTTNTHRLIYLNLRPLMGMKAGAGDIYFRDAEMNTTLTVGVHGTFSYSIADPITFYTTCIKDTSRSFSITEGDGANLQANLKTALQSKLTSTFAVISQMNIPYDQIQGSTDLFINAANEALGDRWSKYGIVLDPVGSNFVLKVDEKDRKRIEEFQTRRTYGGDEQALRGQIVERQLNAMEAAASNEGGATVGLMGMGMMGNVQGMMGMNQMAPPMQPTPPQPAQPNTPSNGSGSTPPQQSSSAPTGNTGWTCSCGSVNQSKFCPGCGAQQPEPPKNETWVCSCGTENNSKFCGNCGSPRPEKATGCTKCGWKPENPQQQVKFCPECGNPLT